MYTCKVSYNQNCLSPIPKKNNLPDSWRICTDGGTLREPHETISIWIDDDANSALIGAW